MTKKVNKKSKHLPFQESVKNLEPTKELLDAIQEGDDILIGRIKVKGYHNVKEMFKDIINTKS